MSTVTSLTKAVTEMASTDIAGPTQDGCSEEGRTKTKKNKKKKNRVSFDEGSLERTADPEEASVAQLRSALEGNRPVKLEDEGSLELTAISEGETFEGDKRTKGERGGLQADCGGHGQAPSIINHAGRAHQLNDTILGYYKRVGKKCGADGANSIIRTSWSAYGTRPS